METNQACPNCLPDFEPLEVAHDSEDWSQHYTCGGCGTWFHIEQGGKVGEAFVDSRRCTSCRYGITYDGSSTCDECEEREAYYEGAMDFARGA